MTALKNLAVKLDSGTDQFTATAVSAALDAVANGGAGFDSFSNLGFVGGVKTEVVEFEVF